MENNVLKEHVCYALRKGCADAILFVYGLNGYTLLF